MLFRYSGNKFTYPLIAAVMVLAISYRPVYRLRPDMPPEFLLTTSPCDSRCMGEQTIAHAYWQSAVMNIPSKYPRGHALPSYAPPEFVIDPAFGPAASAPAIRQLYWQRLHKVWYLSDTWSPHYQWRWTSATDLLNSTGLWLKDKLDRLFTIR